MKKKPAKPREPANVQTEAVDVDVSEVSETPIERDADFRRYYADDLIVDRRRHDTQMSFIIRGSEPAAYGALENSQVSGSSGIQPVRMVQAASEVVRVHISNGRVFNALMQIMDEYLAGVAHDEKRLSTVSATITNLIEKRRVDFLKKKDGDEAV